MGTKQHVEREITGILGRCCLCHAVLWDYVPHDDAQRWCWVCGTFYEHEGNALGLTAAQALERATKPGEWLRQMVDGPPTPIMKG